MLINDKIRPSVHGVGMHNVKKVSFRTLYPAWKDMLKRCYKVPENKRGVVCEQWLRFETYEKDIKENPSQKKPVRIGGVSFFGTNSFIESIKDELGSSKACDCECRCGAEKWKYAR